jgi:hypothetical protein
MSQDHSNISSWARWRTWAGLDFHILVTLLFRGWNILAGAATLLLLPLWLSPDEQGYYYTFASVLALQVFFELGLNHVLAQLVSHEVAHLTRTEGGRLDGPAWHLERLKSLSNMARRWYAVAALLFATIGGGAGALFFLYKGVLYPSQWLGTWVVMVGATAINLWYSPGLAVMEGCGQVGQVARLRLVQSVIGYSLLWLLMYGGAGLWVAAAVPVASVLCTGYWLRNQGDMLRWLARHPIDATKVMHWRTDVLPLQWRIAVSWISGYFILNLFTPLVFAHQGAVEAGRLGMALTLFTAISTIGMSWVNAKAPNFAMHIARGERRELNTKFIAVASRSVAFTAIASLMTVAMACLLSTQDLPFMMRIAPIDVLCCLAVVTIANGAVYAAAIYMRAHREEPMLPVSVVMAVLTGTTTYLSADSGLLPIVLLYASGTMFVSLPWTARLFLRYFHKC